MRTVRNLTLLLVIAVLVGVACWGCTSTHFGRETTSLGKDGQLSTTRTTVNRTSLNGDAAMDMASGLAEGAANMAAGFLPEPWKSLAIGAATLLFGGGAVGYANKRANRRADDDYHAGFAAGVAAGRGAPQVVPAGGPAAGAGAGATEAKG